MYHHPLLLFLFILPLISSNHHLHSYPSIVLNPNDYSKSDLLVHNFQQQFHPTYSYRCLLQTESKYFHLDSFCRLFTRVSLTTICPLNYTLKLEIVLPQNTSIYQVTVQLKYPQPLEFNVTNDQTVIHLPFTCHNQNSLKISSTGREFSLGNAQIRLNSPSQYDQQSCQFEKTTYRIRLKENELYENFLQMKTFGSCPAHNYLLASSNSKRNFDYFLVNSSTGYLSLIRPLDYESITAWKLVLQAHDPSNIPFYTYVLIDVEDINDCPPILSWNFPLQTVEKINETDGFRIEIAIDESKVEQTNVIIANLIASDLDTSNSEVKFQLKLHSSIDLPFEIHGPFADSTFVLSTNRKLDREMQNHYDLHLILSDNGQPQLSSNYQLIIHILDVNDNPPIFDRSIYYVDIQENNLLNTTVLQVHAKDRDENENSRVTYHLENEKYFSIDHQTGTIRANVQFDYEQMTNFTVNVTAIDHPIQGKPFQSLASIFVRIIDQNDHIPKVRSFLFFPFDLHVVLFLVSSIDL